MAMDAPQIGLECFELSLERDRFARAGFTTSYGRVAEYIYRTLLFQAPGEWKMSLLVQRLWRQRPDEAAAFARRGIETDSFFMPPPLPLIQESVGRRWREHCIRRDYIPRIRRRRFDLLHFTGQVPWGLRPLARAEMYATMDFYMARFHPELYQAEIAQLKGRLDSLWLLCISSFTASDAVEFLGIAPERARAIPLAVDHTVYQPEPLEDDAAIRVRYGLPERYVLYVGNFNSRKNVSTLARAMGRVNARRAEPLPLILAGYLGATQRRLRFRLNREFARVLGKTPKHEVDQPTDHDMAAIYRGALMVVHPSRFEGFGFTVLEAAACGVPVVCGRHSALTEVGGDAARFLDDVLDVEEMQAAIQEVADTDALRAGMRSRGLVHAAKFRWERFAREVLAFHDEAIRSTSSSR